MRFSVKNVVLAAALFIAPVSHASAEVFVWQDPATHLSLSYPDGWRQVSNQQPDDVWTVEAPGENDFASCRMRVRDDRRYVIYPRRFADEIQRVHFGRAFWDSYVGAFDNPVIHYMYDDAGLGDGYAGLIDVSYEANTAGTVQKRGIVFAAVYNDKDYIVECSAEAQAYERWHDAFLSVVKSVDFFDAYHYNTTGEYRPFLNDRQLRIHGRKGVDLYTY